MWTLLIVFALVIVPLLFVGFCTHRIEMASMSLMTVCLATVMIFGSVRISQLNVPEGYQKIETYSYVTENGTTETLEGPYFKKGDTYYKQEMGKANWIPFAQCDYVEVDLPKSAFSSNTSPENEANKFCTSCSNELNAKDKFCADCGTKVKE